MSNNIFDRGMKYISRHDYKKAESIFESLVKKGIRAGVEGFYQLGKEIWEWGDYDEAESLLQKVYLGDKILGRKAYYEFGNYLIEQDDLEEARSILEKLLTFQPNKPESAIKGFRLLAEAFIEKEEYDDALDIYEKILKIDPGSLQDKASVASVLIMKGKSSEAITFLEEIIYKDEEYLPAYRLLAHTYFADGNTELAIKYCKDLIDKNPDDSDNFILMGDILFERRNYEEAKKMYAKAARKKGNNPRPYVKLAIVNSTLNNFKAALANYNILLKRFPQKAKYLFHLSLYHLFGGDFDKCLHFYYKAVKGEGGLRIWEKPKISLEGVDNKDEGEMGGARLSFKLIDTENIMERSYNYIEGEKYKDAINSLNDDSIKILDKIFGTVHYYRAMALLNTGRFDESAREFNKLVSSDSGIGEINYTAVGLASLMCKDYIRANEAFSKERNIHKYGPIIGNFICQKMLKNSEAIKQVSVSIASLDQDLFDLLSALFDE